MEGNQHLIDSLLPGRDAFTSDRLYDILKNEGFTSHPTNTNERAYSGTDHGTAEVKYEVNTDYFEFEEVDNGLRCFSDDTARACAAESCRQLYGHDFTVPAEATDLDDSLSKIFRFKFKLAFIPFAINRCAQTVETAANLATRID